MKTPTPLTAGLIVGKGAAVPTPAVSSGPAGMTPLAGKSGGEDTPRSTDAQQAKSASTYHKALTLKLDEARYRALKLAGLKLDLSSQDILVQALDAWLSVKGSSEIS